ncbi:DUF493 family protein [Cellulophaga fucicola]|uniref:DUF493 domain-containing protein n=1 Tax=Cellulophaga fucicola TaxID=76595 RepID=A0A1K1MRU8_9FLAO|nr:DUF493 family protein [Cellulophaga fucicola]SFW25725.1 hypothetical protein SAMN05660313_00836 [Cellulophaga fucicola]
MNTDNPEEFYARLKEQLDLSSTWPANYLYKFIIPTDPEKFKEIEQIFNNTGAVIESKKSKNGKYTSVSITVNMKDSDAIIAKYIEVGKIKGVISL